MKASTWFIPFALILTILTFPISVRDPLIMVPVLVAGTAFGAYALRRDRPRGPVRALLTVQLLLLALIAIALATLMFL